MTPPADTAPAKSLEASCAELWRLELVIESAVRFADPGNYDAVNALLKANRAVSKPPAGKDASL